MGYPLRLALGLLLGLLLYLIWQIHVASAATVALKTQVSVDDHEFTLNQIATITGPATDQVHHLGGLIMGKSPLPGRSLRIYPSNVEQKLKQSGIDLSQHRLVAQGPVKVHRRYEALSPKRISTALRSYIQQNAPWQPDQMKVRPISYRQQHKLPPGKIDLQVMASQHTDWLGADTFMVTILVNNNTAKRINVPVFIEVWGEVVLSAKPLGRGQPIEADDMVVKKMDLARAPTNAIFDPNRIMGFTAKRSIAINSILRGDQFASPMLIRKGDMVRVVAESEHLTITTKAVAQENGGQGERIELMNMNSKKKIYAQVVDGRTVKVQF